MRTGTPALLRTPLHRRDFQGSLALAGLSLVAGCGMWPRNGAAPAKVYRIGFLTSDPTQEDGEAAFRQGLRALGYVEEQTITIEARRTTDEARLAGLATELI